MEEVKKVVKHQRLLVRHGITEEELQKGIDIVAKNLDKIYDISVVLAICDLLACGDIID